MFKIKKIRLKFLYFSQSGLQLPDFPYIEPLTVKDLVIFGKSVLYANLNSFVINHTFEFTKFLAIQDISYFDKMFSQLLKII